MIGMPHVLASGIFKFRNVVRHAAIAKESPVGARTSTARRQMARSIWEIDRVSEVTERALCVQISKVRKPGLALGCSAC